MIIKKRGLITILISLLLISIGLWYWRSDMVIKKTISYFDCEIKYPFSLNNYKHSNIETAGHSGDNDYFRDNAYFRLLECLTIKIEHGLIDSVELSDTILNAIRADNRLLRRYTYAHNYRNLIIEKDSVVKYYRDFFKYDSILMINYENYLKTENIDFLSAALDSIKSETIYRYLYLNKIGLYVNVVPLQLDSVIKYKKDIFGPLLID